MPLMHHAVLLLLPRHVDCLQQKLQGLSIQFISLVPWAAGTVLAQLPMQNSPALAAHQAHRSCVQAIWGPRDSLQSCGSPRQSAGATARELPELNMSRQPSALARGEHAPHCYRIKHGFSVVN
jgi:hypothetical protein